MVHCVFSEIDRTDDDEQGAPQNNQNKRWMNKCAEMLPRRCDAVLIVDEQVNDEAQPLRFVLGLLSQALGVGGAGGIVGELERADEVVDGRATLVGEVLAELGGDGLGGVGVDKQRGADGEAGGAGDEELSGVLPSLYAAHADDGDMCVAGDVAVDAVDEVDGQWADGGPGQAAGAVGQSRGALVNVDGHRGVGVDHAQRVGAAFDGGARGGDDVGGVGRELDDELAGGSDGGAHFLDERPEQGWVGAEDQAVRDVGARDVQLDGVDGLVLGDGCGGVDVVVERVAGDVDDDARARLSEALEVGELFVEEAL